MVGQYIRYSGVALVLAALAVSMVHRGRSSAVGHAVGIAIGLTWATNAIGGGTVVLSLLAALAAVVFGWRHRAGLAAVLVVALVPAVVVLVGDLFFAAA